MNKPQSQIQTFQNQINKINLSVNQKIDFKYPAAIEQLPILEEQNQQLLQTIYNLMLQQHDKIKDYSKEIISLRQQLHKSHKTIHELKNKQADNSERQKQSPNRNESNIKEETFLSIGDGVYSILHFNNQQAFKESVPYLKSKAQFLAIDEFLRIHNNMEQTDRTSSRLQLESAYTVNQLNSKIDIQVSTIKKMSEEIDSLLLQNNKLKTGDPTKHHASQLQSLRKENKALEKQFLDQQIERRKIQSELNHLMNERGSSKTKTAVIYRR